MTYLEVFNEIMKLLYIDSFIQKIKKKNDHNIHLLYFKIMKSINNKENFI